jgi:hypothetical protein
VAKTPTVPKTPKQLAADKVRRLRQQNQEGLKKLKGIPVDTFKANRFGPLMFAMAFGLAGAYFAVSSFASPQVPARAPMLAIEPAVRQVAPGETLKLRIWSDSLDKSVNAVQAHIDYPTQTFDLVGIDATDSAFDLDGASTSQAGMVVLSRRSAQPEGLVGRQYVGSLILRARQAGGPADVHIGEASRLLHSSDAIDILQRRETGSYSVSR